MIPLLLLLHLSLPNLVAQTVQQQATADSSAASQTLLVPYRTEIDSAAQRESLPPALIAAVIQEESRFDPWATRSEPRYLRSHRVQRAAERYAREHQGGANAYTEFVDRSRSYGLMQVMGETAREQGFRNRSSRSFTFPRMPSPMAQNYSRNCSGVTVAIPLRLSAPIIRVPRANTAAYSRMRGMYIASRLRGGHINYSS